MSAISMPAAPLVGAGPVQRAARSFHLHLPLVIGAFAAAGAFTQLNAAPVTGLDAIDDSELVMLMPPPAIEISAADRLRDDPVQTARVPVDAVAQPQPPVKLTKEQRAIARYIARSYRVASESIDRFVYYSFKAAREFRLDPHLILAVMAVESGFNPAAQSSVGAQGLMQVHTRVHSRKFEPFGGADAAYDPLANIKVGAGILSEYVKRYGDVAAGLKAYVGAALLETDGGYGSKVLNRQAEFDAVVRAESRRATEAKAETGATPAMSVEASGTANPGSTRVGL